MLSISWYVCTTGSLTIRLLTSGLIPLFGYCKHSHYEHSCTGCTCTSSAYLRTSNSQGPSWGSLVLGHCFLFLPQAQSPRLWKFWGVLFVKRLFISFYYASYPWVFALKFFCSYIGFQRLKNYPATASILHRSYTSAMYFWNIIFYSAFLWFVSWVESQHFCSACYRRSYEIISPVFPAQSHA